MAGGEANGWTRRGRETAPYTASAGDFEEVVIGALDELAVLDGGDENGGALKRGGDGSAHGFGEVGGIGFYVGSGDFPVGVDGERGFDAIHIALAKAGGLEWIADEDGVAAAVGVEGGLDGSQVVSAAVPAFRVFGAGDVEEGGEFDKRCGDAFDVGDVGGEERQAGVGENKDAGSGGGSVAADGVHLGLLAEVGDEPGHVLAFGHEELVAGFVIEAVEDGFDAVAVGVLELSIQREKEVDRIPGFGFVGGAVDDDGELGFGASLEPRRVELVDAQLHRIAIEVAAEIVFRIFPMSGGLRVVFGLFVEANAFFGREREEGHDASPALFGAKDSHRTEGLNGFGFERVTLGIAPLFHFGGGGGDEGETEGEAEREQGAGFHGRRL